MSQSRCFQSPESDPNSERTPVLVVSMRVGVPVLVADGELSSESAGTGSWAARTVGVSPPPGPGRRRRPVQRQR